MNLQEIYKIADSKESYTKEDLRDVVRQTSSSMNRPRFKDLTKNTQTKYNITILFPIYNEESFLDYSLESFLNSYLYPQTSYQVVFFLNACTDNSLEKTNNILRKQKDLHRKEYNKEKYAQLCDQGLDLKYYYAKDANTYSVLNTSTKGRVNALQVASRIAKENSSDILMSFDTDFILDPSAIYNLSKSAIKNIIQEKNTVAITGSPIIVNNQKYTKIQSWLRNHFVWKDQKYNSLSGCCLVLEPTWLNQNIENNIIEDYALGVKARSQGYKILKVEDARMWGYRTDYRDDLNQLGRSIKGRYQLIDSHPELQEIILNDHFFIQKFSKRLSYIIKNIFIDYQYIFKWLWTFIFVEFAILKAKKDYKTNPNSVDWKPLNSGR